MSIKKIFLFKGDYLLLKYNLSYPGESDYML